MYVQLTDYFIIVVLTIKLANKRRIIPKQQPLAEADDVARFVLMATTRKANSVTVIIMMTI